MKRTIVAAAFAWIIGAVSAVSAQDDYALVMPSALGDRSLWSMHKSVFRPTTQNSPAEVVLPAGEWSSLSMSVPLKRGELPRAVLRMRVRMSNDPVNARHTAVQLRFSDKPKRVIEAATLSQRVLPMGEWQDIELAADIPPEAIALVVQISSHGGVVLELADLEVVIPNYNPVTGAGSRSRPSGTR